MSANDKSQPSDDAPRKPRRRWLQVSLRTLLILVTLLSIGLGTFVHRGERQRRAVAAAKEVGGMLFYDAADGRPMRRELRLRWRFARRSKRGRRGSARLGGLQGNDL